MIGNQKIDYPSKGWSMVSHSGSAASLGGAPFPEGASYRRYAGGSGRANRGRAWRRRVPAPTKR